MPETVKTNNHKRRRQTEGFMLKEYLGYDMEQQLYELRDKLRDSECPRKGTARGKKKNSQQGDGGKP